MPKMKTIDVDDQVYKWLQTKAIAFVEQTPNDVLRRLFSLDTGARSRTPLVTERRQSSHSKQPKAYLKELVRRGYIQESEKLTFNDKRKSLSKRYAASVKGHKLCYNDMQWTMSRLTAEILEREGVGIPSKAYRGPEYWCNSLGLSVKQLWDQHFHDQHPELA
jgi:hypothetical protein